MTSSNSRPNSRGITPANITATTMVFRICSTRISIQINCNVIQNSTIVVIGWEDKRDIHITMSVHSWTLSMMTDRPCGIQDRSTVAARMDSQHTYRPLAAVYSS